MRTTNNCFLKNQSNYWVPLRKMDTSILSFLFMSHLLCPKSNLFNFNQIYTVVKYNNIYNIKFVSLNPP